MSDREYSPTQRRRRCHRGNAKGRRWYRTYKERIRAGLERCRRCGTSQDLAFAHLVPNASGGTIALRNITILCIPCDRRNGARPILDLPSLAEDDLHPLTGLTDLRE